jgi:hypothetical protein
MSDEKSRRSDETVHDDMQFVAKADLYDQDGGKGAVDPVYQAKARVLNQAMQEIGMGRYQVRPINSDGRESQLNVWLYAVGTVRRRRLWLVLVRYLFLQLEFLSLKCGSRLKGQRMACGYFRVIMTLYDIF